jgi:6-pyruvoyltetrahydropterin/6-carboxytetrahydropterin synthase
MSYQVIKTITHEQGWSVAFRQHKASSHCRFLHGYALSCELIFEADTLDDRNWVIDFGQFKSLRSNLEELFDHKTVIAEDDPCRLQFRELESMSALELRVLPQVGCEAFAEHIAKLTIAWMKLEHEVRIRDSVKLVSVEVREHGSNGARYLCR